MDGVAAVDQPVLVVRLVVAAVAEVRVAVAHAAVAAVAAARCWLLLAQHRVARHAAAS